MAKLQNNNKENYNMAKQKNGKMSKFTDHQIWEICRKNCILCKYDLYIRLHQGIAALSCILYTHLGANLR